MGRPHLFVLPKRRPDGFVVMVDKPFYRNYIANKFATRLERALGADVSIECRQKTNMRGAA